MGVFEFFNGYRKGICETFDEINFLMHKVGEVPFRQGHICGSSNKGVAFYALFEFEIVRVHDFWGTGVEDVRSVAKIF